MKRFLKQFFEPTEPPKVQEAKRHLASILERLVEVGPGSPEEALLLNRAADLALAAGEREQALKYYGWSIDAHMALRQFDAAMAICRKLLRLLPDVVRARCTLSWLCLGKGLLDMAREQLDGYVAAAQSAGKGEMAAQQVRLMAQYARDDSFRQYLAEVLTELGDEEGAEALAKWAASLPTPEEIGWDPVVFAALLTPDELEEAKEKGLDLKASRSHEDDDFFLYWPPSG